MTAYPVVHIVDPQRVWEPMPIGRALAWSQVFVRWAPVWPGGAGLWTIRSALRRGRPAGLVEWADRARTAEAAGFSSARYLALQESLDRVWPDRFASHPDTDLDRRTPVRPVRRFDASFWAPWLGLTGGGMADDEATGLLLGVADSAPGPTPGES